MKAYLLVATLSPYFLGQADAHMGISGIRAPDGSDLGFTSRSQKHLGDSFRYPNVPACHGVNQKGPVASLTAGDTWYPKTSFGAPHGGGHCAWAVSTDGTNYYKISDNKDCTLGAQGTTHPLTIPTNLPVQCATSGCVLSWFWTPLLSGSCEIYQNCFDVVLDKATGGIENDASRNFKHGPSQMLTCIRVNDQTHWTTHYGPILSASSPTPKPAQPTPLPTFSDKVFTERPTPQPTPQPTVGGAPNDECVSHSQLIAINSESSYWPRCDMSQDIKGDVANLEKIYELGLYCGREWANELNKMLKELGYCNNRAIIRNFLAQTAYETAYFTTLGQPIDDGSGIIHMIPANWGPNVDDMEALFPGQGIKADYSSRDQAGKKMFFKEPRYAYKSAAAWFKRTNRVIPGCGKDLFPLEMSEQTLCILGRPSDRSEALTLVSKHIKLDGTVPTNPPTNTPKPTLRPTPQPTTPRPTPQPTTQGGSSSSSCSEEMWSRSKIYTGGMQAQHDGSLYRAKWWTNNNVPTQGGPWELVKSCDETKAKVCGGVPTYINGQAYGGGSLVAYNDKVYKASWWIRAVPGDSDVWVYVKDCETVVADPAMALALVAEPEQKEGKKYRNYFEVTFSGLSYGNPLADDDLTLVQAEQEIQNIKDRVVVEFTALLLAKYGTFINQDVVKGFELKAGLFNNGKPYISIILELEYDSAQDATDGVAVLSQHETAIVEDMKMAVHRILPLRIAEAKVVGNSGVVVVDEIANDDSTTSAAMSSVPSTLLFGTLFAVLSLITR